MWKDKNNSKLYMVKENGVNTTLKKQKQSMANEQVGENFQ